MFRVLAVMLIVSGIYNIPVSEDHNNIEQIENLELIKSIEYNLSEKFQSESNTIYTPRLRNYEIKKNNDIWYASDPSSYIIPENEIVKFYANQLYVNYDGRIKFKNVQKPLTVDHNGNILEWTDESFKNNYVNDWKQFGDGKKGGFDNDDYWINADYYLANGMEGDCEDWAIAISSMMLSGEMSIIEGDEYLKQVIPAKVVLGYIGNRDAWVEYQAYDKTWITSTSLHTKDKEISVTIFIENNDDFEGKYEFTNKYFIQIFN